MPVHVRERTRHIKNGSREEVPFSGPLSFSSSSGFAWAKRPQEDRSFARSRTRSSSRGQFPGDVDQDSKSQAKENIGLRELPSRDVPISISRVNSKVQDREPHDVAKRAVLKKWSQLERPDSFDSCDTYHSQNFSNAMYLGVTLSSKNSFKVSWFNHLLDIGFYLHINKVVTNMPFETSGWPWSRREGWILRPFVVPVTQDRWTFAEAWAPHPTSRSNIMVQER